MTAATTDGARGTPGTISERLASFLLDRAARGVPDAVRHEAKRLILNQLKASVGAVDHPAVRILHDWAARRVEGAEEAASAVRLRATAFDE